MVLCIWSYLISTTYCIPGVYLCITGVSLYCNYVAVLTIPLPGTTFTLRVYTSIQESNPGNTVLNHAISLLLLQHVVTYIPLVHEYLACYTIMKYLMHTHIIYELCCCLLLWIILLSGFCNITKVDKTLILSILTTYNLSMQNFVTFGAFIKVNIYITYTYISLENGTHNILWFFKLLNSLRNLLGGF